jgi:DNA-binding NarL/FixJ family response regulator
MAGAFERCQAYAVAAMGATGEQQACTRTVLADGQPKVRDALRILVTQGLGMQVVDEAGTLQTLQRQVRAHRPDLAIVEWDLLGQSASVLAGLRACSPGLRIVVIGLRPEMRPAALAAGADGFVSKVDAPDDVIGVLQPCHKTTRETTGGLS